jgi:hypothetical protein
MLSFTVKVPTNSVKLVLISVLLAAIVPPIAILVLIPVQIEPLPQIVCVLIKELLNILMYLLF